MATYTGSCGVNATWIIDDVAGTMVVDGTGAMTDYSNPSDSNPTRPGYDAYKDSVKSLVIKSGITTVGSYAFVDFEKLYTIQLEEGVVRINRQGFINLPCLSQISLPLTLTEVATYNGGLFTNNPIFTNNSLSEFGGKSPLISSDRTLLYGGTSSLGMMVVSSIANYNTKITIPYGVMYLYCILSGPIVQSIQIPISVLAIDGIENAENLTSISFYGTEELYGSSISIYNIINVAVEKIHIPYNTIIGPTGGVYEGDSQSAFRKCNKLKEITFKDGAEISGTILYKCNGIENVDWSNVHALSTDEIIIFCDALKTVDLGSAATITPGIIHGCASLETISVDGSIIDANSKYFSYEGSLYEKRNGGGYDLIAMPSSRVELHVLEGTKEITTTDSFGWNIGRIQYPSTLITAPSADVYPKKLVEIVNYSGLTVPNPPRGSVVTSIVDSNLCVYTWNGVDFLIWRREGGSVYTILSSSKTYGELTLPDVIIFTDVISESGSGVVTEQTTVMPDDVDCKFMQGVDVNYRDRVITPQIEYLDVGNGVHTIGNREVDFTEDNRNTTGGGAFAYNSLLKTVVLGERVAYINGYSFEDCGKLETVIFGAYSGYIGPFAFAYTAIKDLDLPGKDTNVVVCGSAFAYCEKLGTIRIGNGGSHYTNIDLGRGEMSWGPFYGCIHISLINFGKNHTYTIRNDAFENIGNDHRIIPVISSMTTIDPVWSQFYQTDVQFQFIEYADLEEYQITFDLDGYQDVFDDDGGYLRSERIGSHDNTDQIIGVNVMSTINKKLPNFPMRKAQPRYVFKGWRMTYDTTDPATITEWVGSYTEGNYKYPGTYITSEYIFDTDAKLHAIWETYPEENPSSFCYFETSMKVFNTDGSTDYPLSYFFMPIVKSIEDSVTAQLTQLDTVVCGYDNKFVCDMGTIRKLNVTFERVTPSDYDDFYNYEPSVDDVAPDMRIKTIKKVGEKWSNAKWLEEFIKFTNFWQNNSYSAGRIRRGGLHFHFEPEASTRPESDRKYKELYPELDLNVFINGQINTKMDTNKLTITVPLVVAAMRPQSDTHVKMWQAHFHKCLESNGEMSAKEITKTVPYGFEMDVPSPDSGWVLEYLANGKVFSGWTRSGDFLYDTGSVLPFEANPQGDTLHFYAKWENVDAICIFTPKMPNGGALSFVSNSDTDDATYTQQMNPMESPYKPTNMLYPTCKATVTLYGGGGGGASGYVCGLDTVYDVEKVDTGWKKKGGLIGTIGGFAEDTYNTIVDGVNATTKTIVCANCDINGGGGGGACGSGMTHVFYANSPLEVTIGKGGRRGRNTVDDGVLIEFQQGGHNGSNGEQSTIKFVGSTNEPYKSSTDTGLGGTCGRYECKGGNSGGGAGGKGTKDGQIGTYRANGCGGGKAGIGHSFNAPLFRGGRLSIGGGGGGGANKSLVQNPLKFSTASGVKIIINGETLESLGYTDVTITSEGGDGAYSLGEWGDAPPTHDSHMAYATDGGRGWSISGSSLTYKCCGGGGGGTCYLDRIDSTLFNPFEASVNGKQLAADGAPGIVIVSLKYR